MKSVAAIGTIAICLAVNGYGAVGDRLAELQDMRLSSQGWHATNGVLQGESPEYSSLPETARDGCVDDSWTYHTIHPVVLWRYALAGAPAWTDYTVAVVVKIEKPAPLNGFRGGETFFNYQWGREAIGSDAAIVVRWQDPDNNYMVRLSSGYGHVELWKTHGGVVRVKAHPFEPGKDYQLRVTVSGPWIVVSVDGKELIRYFDRVEPVLQGQAGVAVRESRVSFADFRVERAAAMRDAPPAYRPAFHRQTWVGKDYIFDGDEPVAWFCWNPGEGLELREMKLRAGLMPMVMPCAGIQSYDLQPTGDLAVVKTGKTFEFHSYEKSKDESFDNRAVWVLSATPGGDYIWDKRVKFSILKPGKTPVWPQIDDPYFYQMVSPPSNKLPKCRSLPNSCIVESTNQTLIAFPNLNHHSFEVACADAQVVRPGGCAVPTIDGWGVALQVCEDTPLRFNIGFCHWGLDMHVCPVDPKPAGAQGYEGHIRYLLWDKARVNAALAAGRLPVPNRKPPTELFNHAEPVNRMDSVSPAISGETTQFWVHWLPIDFATDMRKSADREAVRL